MRQLEPGERGRGAGERLESLRRSPTRFDDAMILFNEVVKVLARSDLHVPPLHALVAQQPQGTAAGNVLIEGDRPRETVSVRVERLTKESLGSGDAAVTTQQEIDRLAELVHCSIQVVPPTPDRDVGLVDPPRGPGLPTEAIPALAKLGDVALDPTKDRRVSEFDTRSASISTRSR